MPELAHRSKREDVTAMTDSVHCSFVDSKKADPARWNELLSNCYCDLSELSGRGI